VSPIVQRHASRARDIRCSPGESIGREKRDRVPFPLGITFIFSKQTLFTEWHVVAKCTAVRIDNCNRTPASGANEHWRGKERIGEIFIQKIGDSAMLK